SASAGPQCCAERGSGPAVLLVGGVGRRGTAADAAVGRGLRRRREAAHRRAPRLEAHRPLGQRPRLRRLTGDPGRGVREDRLLRRGTGRLRRLPAAGGGLVAGRVVLGDQLHEAVLGRVPGRSAVPAGGDGGRGEALRGPPDGALTGLGVAPGQRGALLVRRSGLLRLPGGRRADRHGRRGDHRRPGRRRRGAAVGPLIGIVTGERGGGRHGPLLFPLLLLLHLPGQAPVLLVQGLL